MPNGVSLSSLFTPHSVAVVGASERPGSLGSTALLNSIGAGFSGRLYAVNPKYKEVHSIACYPNIEALPEPAECIVFCIPAWYIPDSLAQAGAAGTRAAIIYASGFAEAGENGEMLNRQLLDIAERYGIRITGPNCMGLASFPNNFLPYSAPIDTGRKLGSIAAVCQSGSVTIALLNSGRELDFSYVVSSGNEVSVTLEDYIEYFIEDTSTSMVMAFVEGFRNPSKMSVVALRALSLGKPIVILKVGRSETGERIAIGHSGALAGSDAVHDAFFEKHSILRAADMDEWLDTARLLASGAAPAGDKIAAVTSSGGEAGLLADLADDAGVSLAQFSQKTLKTLAGLLPPFTNIGNPLDAWGAGDIGETYQKCLEAIGADPEVDLVAIFEDLQTGIGEGQAEVYRQMAQSIARAVSVIEKPLVVATNISGSIATVPGAVLKEAGIVTLQGTSSSLRSIRNLIRYQGSIAGSKVVETMGEPNIEGMRIFEDAVAAGLNEMNCSKILAAYGISVARQDLAQNYEEAAAIAGELGYPVALKINSESIRHKTDHGLVYLNITDQNQLQAAYASLLGNAGKVLPQEAPYQVLVQEMLYDKHTIEVIVSLFKDQQFGSVIMVGAGGVLVELTDDVAMRLVPIGADEAQAMLMGGRLGKLLDGVRGNPPADREAIVDTMLKVSQLAVDLGDRIVELDINPLMVYPEGVFAADAMIVVSEP